LIDVFGAGSTVAAKALLAQATNWHATVIDALTGPQGLGLTLQDFTNENALLRLHSAVTLTKRVSVSADTLFDWAAPGSNVDELANAAQAIKKAVHAKYDEDTWLIVSKQLNDLLRQSQRDALVAYLLPQLRMDDPNQLFEFFLIDVQ